MVLGLWVGVIFPASSHKMNNGVVRGEWDWIIQLVDHLAFEDFQNSLQQNKQWSSFQIKKVRTLSRAFNIHQIQVYHPDGASAMMLTEHPQVVGFQRNGKLDFRKAPNDEEYHLQWGLDAIGAEQVWEITTGGATANGDKIVVAILDDGFDIDHQDLADNLWINKAEIDGDSIDNDGNGYIDDIHGWDFNLRSPEFRISQHGQSVAGIIGAKGNNGLGVTGINWDIELMLFPISSIDGVVAAYDYIIQQRQLYNQSKGQEGAFIVATNASFGQNGKFCEDQPVWGGMYDKLGAVGVLTGAGTTNNNWDVDIVGDMPTTCTSDFILTTLNVTDEGEKYRGSAFGKFSIDVGSPGENSYTTKPYDNYGFFSSNSAAAPHLTGAIALLYANPSTIFATEALTEPRQTALKVRNAILGGVEQLPDLVDKTVTGGRIHLGRSLEVLLADYAETGEELTITKVFPNPFRGTLNIQYDVQHLEEHQLRIYDILGRLVYEQFFLPNAIGPKQLTINPSIFTEGVYLLQLDDTNQLVNWKITVH